ncbi:MAG: FAD-dependent oxidoreductase [Terriglobia bacterium]
MENPTNVSAEVIIVGGGLAGASLAAVLGRRGRSVILVDPRPTCPPVFKAEKIDQEQVHLLSKFGLLKPMLANSGRVREVWKAFNGGVFRTIQTEQYGISYPDMVNALRANLPAGVKHRQGRVEAVANSEDVQRVKLGDGEELTSRLVVLASGVSREIQSGLRLGRRVIQKDQSYVFGFTIAAPDSRPFDFDSVTYYSLDPAERIDYLTLFRIGNAMRANLFVFRAARDPWVREFIQEPDRMLRHSLPKLDHVTGEFRVISRVESGGGDLYRVDGYPQPGVVLIGDAFQSVCPSTGMGLDKILTDVDALSECVPRWFATPGMGKQKLADFYHHPRKLAKDHEALHRAINQRRAATELSPRWRIHRFLLKLWRRVLTAACSPAAQNNDLPEARMGNQPVSIPPTKVLEKRTSAQD